MAYATRAELEALWGPSDVLLAADWDNSGDRLDTTVVANITNSLEAASSEMDRYIAVRYQLPLTTVPDDLVRVCADIAMYRLSPRATSMTELKTERYKQAVGFLKDLAAGKATLGPQQNGQTPAVIPETTILITSGDQLTRSDFRRLL